MTLFPVAERCLSGTERRPSQRFDEERMRAAIVPLQQATAAITTRLSGTVRPMSHIPA
ncbi:MAG: hypothetical protein L0G46_10165 [Kocuria sp.]|nr:hypothetical protein [Kocuria sp.]